MVTDASVTAKRACCSLRPTQLLLPAFALLAAAPAEVYLVPNDAQALVVGQYVVAALLIAGGSTALAASQLISKLQR